MPNITLAHGNGGVLTRELIDEIFAARLRNSLLDTDADAANLHLSSSRWAMTTDSFTVQPLFFPGGNIGSLAIHGTVNDLSVAGARPRFLSLNAIIEEGFSFEQLTRIVDSMAQAARHSGVSIVTGDTKVVPQGQGGGIYLATTGIGEHLLFDLDARRITPGDCLLVSGPIGNHGIAVMMAREEFGLSSSITSDSNNVFPLIEVLDNSELKTSVKLLRDPTRGGLNMVLQDWNRTTALGISLEQNAIPVEAQVQTVCDLLGYEPINLACEGRVVAVVAQTAAEAICRQWQQTAEGRNAAIIGHFTQHHQQVIFNTPIGGQRVLQPLINDPLPRIC